MGRLYAGGSLERTVHVENGAAGRGGGGGVLRRDAACEDDAATRCRKLRGTLTAADDSGCTIAVPTRVKPEGAKRPQTVDIEQQLTYNDIKQTKPIITV